MKSKLILIVVLALVIVQLADAGILGLLAGYGGCQTACNAAWVTCMSSAGLIAGTVTAGAAAPAAAMACSGLQGVCMASCAATFLVSPTP